MGSVGRNDLDLYILIIKWAFSAALVLALPDRNQWIQLEIAAGPLETRGLVGIIVMDYELCLFTSALLFRGRYLS